MDIAEDSRVLEKTGVTNQFFSIVARIDVLHEWLTSFICLKLYVHSSSHGHNAIRYLITNNKSEATTLK